MRSLYQRLSRALSVCRAYTNTRPISNPTLKESQPSNEEPFFTCRLPSPGVPNSKGVAYSKEAIDQMRQQADSRLDLNAYVYEFAEDLLRFASPTSTSTPEKNSPTVWYDKSAGAFYLSKESIPKYCLDTHLIVGMCEFVEPSLKDGSETTLAEETKTFNPAVLGANIAAYKLGQEAGVLAASRFVRGRYAGRAEGSDIWLELGKIERGILDLRTTSLGK